MPKALATLNAALPESGANDAPVPGDTLENILQTSKV